MSASGPVISPETTSQKKGGCMSNKAVFCIADSVDQAEQIVNSLKASGFYPDDISLLFPDKNLTRDFAYEKNTKAPEGATAGAGAGGLLGGALGLLVGIGALTIPGVGPFIAAGPVLAALSGAAVGGAVGGLAGALIGMGIPEIEAKLYESRIKSGKILISVHTENPDEITKAKGILEALKAHDITSTTEATPAKRDQASVPQERPYKV